jgi:ribosomal-protein-alanine N-acetyltransferase
MLDINFSPFPVLHTERLILRRPANHDAGMFYFLRTDERMLKYSHKAPPQSVQDVVELIEKFNTTIDNNDGINWAITLKNNDEFIGNIGLWRIEKEYHRAEVGYSLHPDLHGQGIMHEAMVAVLDYGFKTLKLHTIEGCVNPNNQPSINVLQRNGFVKEGHFKEALFYNGNYFDSAVYTLFNPNV